jgi:hypothetical protein
VIEELAPAAQVHDEVAVAIDVGVEEPEPPKQGPGPSA